MNKSLAVGTDGCWVKAKSCGHAKQCNDISVSKKLRNIQLSLYLFRISKHLLGKRTSNRKRKAADDTN